ncbi:ATP-binding cassette domain-containing protein [Acuticoccus sp. M5D2P5]|nr:oligopeptide/dipeptide ABC transporter ATP-binding protein [Acuticoccus kalidii]MCF3934172.1 ATP-binding cassette domain-containing protein [Acuticoccus kalidii]
MKRQIVHAVSDVSFTIERGETFALVGESGSGKSTIAKVVVGLMPAKGGSIVIDGVTMGEGSSRDVRALRRRMQMIFQDPYASLNPRMRVDKILAEPIRAFGLMSGRNRRARVAELLEAVGLHPRDGRKYPHEFSGGQRQRICIARALASNPAFLVCDEPTSALDVSVQAQILNLMKDLQDELGLTYLFISHNLAVVRHMANRIGVLYLGRLAEVAPSEALFSTPRHPYTKMLLDALPDVEMSGRARTPVTGEIPNPIDPPTGCAFHPRCPLADTRCRAERPELAPAPDTPANLVACHAVEEGRDRQAA